jgi:segregation and condensation protein B
MNPAQTSGQIFPAGPASGVALQAMENPMEYLRKPLEAILFVAEQPVTTAELVEVLQRATSGTRFAPETVEEALLALQAQYEHREAAWRLHHIGGGWQFLSHENYSEFARQLLLSREKKKLSRAALETLAIVAYRQPVTKAEIEHIRGVGCDYAINKLLEKTLVEPAGRSDLPGRPLLYRTTQFFLEYFAMNDLSELPRQAEFQAEDELLAQSFRNPLFEGDPKPEDTSLFEAPAEAGTEG